MKTRLQFIFLMFAVTLIGACGGGGGGSSTPPATTNPPPVTPPPAAQSSSGSMGVATFKDPSTGNTVTKAYIPIGTTISVVTLASVPASAATLASGAVEPKLAALSVAPPVQAITVANNMDACALDATTLKGVCISYTNSNIIVVDIVANTVLQTIDTKVSASAGFSGGSCIVCGVLIDYQRGKVALTVQTGYMTYDLNNLAAPPVSILTEPSENFTMDVPNNRIISPSYGVHGPKLQIIKLDTNEIFNYAGTLPFTEPDGASVDPATGILLVTDEVSANFELFNLNEATFDATAKTFTAPSLHFAAGLSVPRMSGSAIELVSHIAVLEQEIAGQSVSIALLPTTAVTGAPPSPTFHWGKMPNRPDGRVFGNSGDPHGIAVLADSVNGNPFGFVITFDKKYLAKLDLTAFKNATAVAATTTGEVNLSTGVVEYIQLF